MAITRNASESLQIVLNGFDMKPGEEFLTTNHDYPRMITTLKQRKLREGIEFRQAKIKLPAKSHDDLFDTIEKAITPKTKILLISHVIFLNGQIMPVRRICDMARKRGIITIVDGAHAFAHLNFTHADLGCDIYGVSLHKWTTAPIGTGFLYVRKGLIKEIWPLTASEDPRSENIHKFEEIGTHPAAPRQAIAEALMFYDGIGPARKEARLRFLRDYWANRLLKNPRTKMHTNLDPAHSCAIATVSLEGIDSQKLMEHLWGKHKIVVVYVKHDDFEGMRVTPNVYTSRRDLDLFCDAMEDVLKNGLPGEPGKKA